MSLARWTIQLHGNVHSIELDRSFWSGKRTVLLDGQQIFTGKGLQQTGIVHEFVIDGHQCAVLMDAVLVGQRLSPGRPGYSLTVDGRVALVEQRDATQWPTNGSILAFAALIPILILAGIVSLFFIPTPIPAYSELEPIIAKVADKTIDNSSRFTGSVEVKLAGSPVSLRYSSADAHYGQVTTLVQKDDDVIVWVAKREYQQGGTASIWQIQRATRVLVSYPEQVEIKTIWNRFWQASGAAILLGALFLIIALPRARRRPSRQSSIGGRTGSQPPAVSNRSRHWSKRWAAILRFVLATAVLAAAFSLLWWVVGQTYRAMDLGADSLAMFLPLVQGILMSLPTIIVFDRIGRFGQLYDWTIWLSGIMALLLGAFETTYYLPSSYLVSYIGTDLAPALAPLFMLFSGPSAYIFMLAIAVALPSSPYLKCFTVAAVWLASFTDAAFLTNLVPLTSARAVVLTTCIFLVAWSAIVALRLVVLMRPTALALTTEMPMVGSSANKGQGWLAH